MHRFFILDSNDDLFNENFEKAIRLVSHVDFILSDDYFTRLTQAMESKKNQHKRIFNIRYLAYAYAFFESNPEYAMLFLKTFMFGGMDNNALPSIQENMSILIETHVPDPSDFDHLLQSIVHMLDFGGYKFFLNMIYFCNELNDLKLIENFIAFYEKTAKTVYFEYQFAILNLDEISSDEELG